MTDARNTRFTLLVAVIAAALPFAGSCGNQVGSAKEGTITGTVLKSAVSGADVTAFSVDGARRGDQIGSGTTAEDGTFSISVGSHAGPAIVCARAGTYVEEATGGLVQLGQNELCTLTLAHEAGGTTSVIVTPLTTLHVGLTGCFFDGGRDADLTAAESHSALRLNDFFAAGQTGFDLRRSLPLDPTLGLAPSLTPEAWAGIVVAGLSESAKAYAIESGLDPGVRVTAATLTAALTQDIDDGACVFDGQTATARLVQGTVELSEDALRGSPQGLATSILRFLENERNASGIAPDNVRDLVQRMQAHTSEIFGGGGGGADIDDPIVTYTEPEAGSTRGGSVRVSARAVDASPIVEFKFIEPAQANFTASAFVCTDETNTDCTLTGVINTSAAPVVAGPLTVSTRATDDAGNSTTAPLVFTVNNTLPQITVQAPREETPPQKVRGVFEIIASAEDVDDISSLTVSIPGLGLCDDQPTSPCRDLEPNTRDLRVRWDTTTMPEGNIVLSFEAIDGAGQRNDTSVTVEIDNNDIGAVTGAVDLGTPVVGATVTALVWTGRVRGSVLGTATTNEQGAYRVNLDDRAHASILMVVTGGSFVDPATGEPFVIAEGQELTTAVGAIAPGEVRTANVNAWTTLAAARARHTPAGGLEVDAINLNNALLSQHMRRVPFGAPFSITSTQSADLTTEVVRIDNQRAVLALSHAGLSRLAAEISVRQVDSIGAVNMAGLITVLAADLQADPSLDGIGPTDILTIGPDLEPITSLTTRFDLVAALDRYLKATPLVGANVNRNVSGITANDAFQGRLYEAMAEDNRFELYPEPGRPFDTTPPVITLDFGGNNSDRQPGDSLQGTVQINGEARDDSAIAAFGGTLTLDGTFIPDDDSSSDRLRVFIATDVLPNGADAAGACPNAEDAADVSILQDSVCLCAIAEDVQANVAEKILCFTRPRPAPVIAQPPPNAPFAANQTVPLGGAATSGFNLASCTAALTSSPARTPPGLTQPVPSGTSCSFEQSIPVSSFDDATWTLTMTATDIAGRSESATRLFITDKTPPTVAQPTLSGADVSTSGGAQFVKATTGATSTYTATTTATDSAGIRSVVFRVTPQVGAPLDFAATRSGTTNTFTATINDTGADGARTVVAIATDTNNNTATSTGRAITKDTTKPTFVWLPPGNQATWLNQAPGEPVTECTQESGSSAIRLNCTHAPSTQVSTVSSFYSVLETAPSNTISIWRNHLGALITPDGGVLPKTRGTPGDPGATASGVATVLYDANTTCPTAPTNTATLDASRTTATVTLGNSPMTIDLASRTASTSLCMTAVTVDNAGNRSDPATIRFRWQTVSPPLNVLWNPIFDETNTTASDDFATFAGPNAKAFVEGNASNIRVAHAYVSNPYPFDVLFRLTPSGVGAALPLVADVTHRRQVSGTRATQWLVSTGGGSGFQAPSVGSHIVSDGFFPDYVPQNAAAVQTARAWRFNSVTNSRDANVTNLSAPLTAVNTVRSNLATGNLPSPTVRYFSVNQTTGVISNVNQLAQDAQSFVTVPAAAVGFGGVRTPTVVLAVYFSAAAPGSNTLNLLAPGASSTTSLLRDSFGGQAPVPPTTKFLVDEGTTQFAYADVIPDTFLNVTPLSTGSGAHTCGGTSTTASCFWVKNYGELRNLKVRVPVRTAGAPTIFGTQATKAGSTVADYAATLPVKAPQSLLDSATTDYSLRESAAP